MKRVSLAIAFFIIMSIFFGCSASVSPTGVTTSLPSRPAAQASSSVPVDSTPASQTETPTLTPGVTVEPTETLPQNTEPMQPEPVKVVPKTNVYTNEGLGLTFTVPKSWVGKYRVEEGEGYLSVYYGLVESDDSDSTELFTIMKKTCSKWDCFSDEWEFGMNGTTYGWGTTSFDIELASDNETYVKMQYDVPAISHTLRSVIGKVPDHIKTIWLELVPKKTEYKTTLGLGIAFTLPKSWIGKCRIDESEDCVSFSFYPKKPINKYNGNGFFFAIDKNALKNDYSDMDSVRQFTINGITYVSYTTTDVCYSEDQPEFDTFMSMNGDSREILDSIRAVK